MEDFNIGNIIGPMVAERYNALLDQTMYMVKNFYLLQSELEMAKLKKTKILPGDKYDTFLIEKNMDMLDKVGEDYRQRVAQIKEEMKKELGVDHL